MDEIKKILVTHITGSIFQVIERTYYNGWDEYSDKIQFQGSLPECHSYLWLKDNGFDILTNENTDL